MKKYRYISIKEDGELHNDHPYFRIFNNWNGAELGMIFYDKPQKQYVFTQSYWDQYNSERNVKFNSETLHDILNFIEVEIPKQ